MCGYLDDEHLQDSITPGNYDNYLLFLPYNTCVTALVLFLTCFPHIFSVKNQHLSLFIYILTIHNIRYVPACHSQNQGSGTCQR